MRGTRCCDHAFLIAKRLMWFNLRRLKMRRFGLFPTTLHSLLCVDVVVLKLLILRIIRFSEHANSRFIVGHNCRTESMREIFQSDSLTQIANPHSLAQALPHSLERVVVLELGVNSEMMLNRCDQVGVGYRLRGDVAAGGGCRSVDLSAADTAASKQSREGVRPVIAASRASVAALCELPDARRSAELSYGDHQCRIE